MNWVRGCEGSTIGYAEVALAGKTGAGIGLIYEVIDVLVGDHSCCHSRVQEEEGLDYAAEMLRAQVER